MTLPPKLITILCLVQFFFVSAGFLITRACLKIYDQFIPVMLGTSAPEIPLLLQIVRSYGLWFLFVPVALCVSAAVRGRVTNGDGNITEAQFAAGLALTVAISLAFTYSALYSIRISFGPP